MTSDCSKHQHSCGQSKNMIMLGSSANSSPMVCALQACSAHVGRILCGTHYSCDTAKKLVKSGHIGISGMASLSTS